ncbi:hypothetical protein FRC10_012068 [Ceratobasidium sp. 414]|nr:hypothetical protein FRC10_012068 [Ceratobasidium sp. 414]
MDESSDYDSDGHAEPTAKCPCCSRMLGRRQIDQHIEELAGWLVSSDVEMSDDEASNAGDIPVATDDPGFGAVGDLGAGDNISSDQVPEPVPIDIPNYVDPAILPLLAPIYRLLRNPPVAINNWADHDEDEASEAKDEGPIDCDQAPEYAEREAPLGFDPNDEPDLADNELCNLFEENMEDLDDDEWIELYSSVLSKKDWKTLELLTTRLRTHFSRTTWDDLHLGVCQELAIPSEFVAWRHLRILRPGAQSSFPLDKLPMRTQQLFNTHYTRISAHQTKAAREQYKKDTGIVGQSILTRLQSIDLPSSAPYDIMHLLFESLVPNMVHHWTGTFKGLGQGTGNYELEEGEWERIGTLPDITQHMNLYKAEAYSFWIQYIVPIVLKGKIPDKY